jgi:hypothetical protein
VFSNTIYYSCDHEYYFAAADFMWFAQDITHLLRNMEVYYFYIRIRNIESVAFSSKLGAYFFNVHINIPFIVKGVGARRSLPFSF